MKPGNRILIDTHCHLDAPLLYARLSEIIAAAEASGIRGFIVPGVEPQGWERMISLRVEGRIFVAPGVHPAKAGSWNQDVGDRLKQVIPDIVAIGEIGLDYSQGMPPRELQQKVFREQLKIARAAGLPVIIHCRRAFADAVRIMAEERAADCGGVMHAFSGSLEIARECISMGLKIGIAGPVTWGNALKPVRVAKEIPLDHLLLETDSPDLSPEPHRGKVNEPAFLADTAVRVAEIKGASVDEVAAVTSANARSLFRLGRKLIYPT